MHVLKGTNHNCLSFLQHSIIHIDILAGYPFKIKLGNHMTVRFTCTLPGFLIMGYDMLQFPAEIIDVIARKGVTIFPFTDHLHWSREIGYQYRNAGSHPLRNGQPEAFVRCYGFLRN